MIARDREKEIANEKLRRINTHTHTDKDRGKDIRSDLVSTVQSILSNITYVPHPVGMLETSQQQPLAPQILKKKEKVKP